MVVDLLRRDDDTDQASDVEADSLARVLEVVCCHNCTVVLHADTGVCSGRGPRRMVSKEDRLEKLGKSKDLLVLLR